MMRRSIPFLTLSLIVSMLLTAGCGGDAPTGPSASSPLPFAFSLTPATVPAGSPSEGSVLTRDAVRNDVTIYLSSSDAVASVPASVMLRAGLNRATFPVTTRLVAADTVARIRATAGETTQEASLQVVSPVAKPPTLDTLTLDTAVVHGGQNANGIVRVTGPAPTGGLLVSLRSNSSAATVPANVSVQAGSLTTMFVISTHPVEIDTQFEITASYLDQTRTVPFRVIP